MPTWFLVLCIGLGCIAAVVMFLGLLLLLAASGLPEVEDE